MFYGDEDLLQMLHMQATIIESGLAVQDWVCKNTSTDFTSFYSSQKSDKATFKFESSNA